MVGFAAALWGIGQLIGAMIQRSISWRPTLRLVVAAWIVTGAQLIAYALLPVGITQFLWTFAQVPIGVALGIVWWRYRRG